MLVLLVPFSDVAFGFCQRRCLYISQNLIDEGIHSKIANLSKSRRGGKLYFIWSVHLLSGIKDKNAIDKQSTVMFLCTGMLWPKELVGRVCKEENM